MSMTLPSTRLRTDQIIPWLGRALPLTFLVSVAAVCGLLVIYGPQLRTATDAREASIVDQEDKAFCSKFGIGPGTGRYGDCAAGLNEIRTRYLERRVSESIL